MGNQPKRQSGSAYDLNSVSRDRAKNDLRPATLRPRSLSPYTLRGERSLAMLRSRTEKNDPK
jgi:hypothetical protein